MPARRFGRTISGVLREMGACSASQWRGYKFADALRIMSWDNFEWLTHRLTRDKKHKKDVNAAYLRGARETLNAVQVRTGTDSYGVPQWRYLNADEKVAAARTWGIHSRLRSVLNVR